MGHILFQLSITNQQFYKREKCQILCETTKIISLVVTTIGITLALTVVAFRTTRMLWSKKRS